MGDQESCVDITLNFASVRVLSSTACLRSRLHEANMQDISNHLTNFIPVRDCLRGN